MRGMQDLLAKLMDMWATHPAAAVGVVAGVMFAVLIWGVVATSYRYR